MPKVATICRSCGANAGYGLALAALTGDTLQHRRAGPCRRVVALLRRRRGRCLRVALGLLLGAPVFPLLTEENSAVGGGECQVGRGSPEGASDGDVPEVVANEGAR